MKSDIAPIAVTVKMNGITSPHRRIVIHQNAHTALLVSSPGAATCRDPSEQGPMLRPPGAIRMSPSRHHDPESNTVCDSESSLDKLCPGAGNLRMTQNSLPEQLSMTRRDPSQNMACYYAIVLQPTLYGEVSIQRTWGQIGTRGQSLQMAVATQSEAKGHADRIERQKRRRGYL